MRLQLEVLVREQAEVPAVALLGQQVRQELLPLKQQAQRQRQLEAGLQLALQEPGGEYEANQSLDYLDSLLGYLRYYNVIAIWKSRFTSKHRLLDQDRSEIVHET